MRRSWWLVVLVAAGCGGQDSGAPPALEAVPVAALAPGRALARAAPSCGSVDPGFRGALCGPLDRPCRVLVDEEVDPPAFRNDVPALALDEQGAPHLLFAVASGGYLGRYATRGADGWTVEMMPAPMAAGGLVWHGGPVALVDDGNRHVASWLRDAGGWRQRDLLSDVSSIRAHGFAQDRGGCLYAVVASGTRSTPVLAEHDGRWGYRPLGDPQQSHDIKVAVALSQAARPHAAYWETSASGFGLVWQAPPAAPEQVLALGGSLEWFPLAMAVSGGDAADPVGQPHLLFNRYNATPGSSSYGSALVYATRAAGRFQLTTVAEGSDNEFVFERCGPRNDCPFSYVTYRPIAVLASGAGEVRLLYVRYAVSSDGQDMHIDGQLEMAWPDGATLTSTVLATGIAPLGGTARIAPDGRIHLAVYDGALAWSDSSVRYLVIGR